MKVYWLTDISRLKQSSCNVAGDGPRKSVATLNEECFKKHGFSLKRERYLSTLSNDYFGFRIIRTSLTCSLPHGHFLTEVNNKSIHNSSDLLTVLTFLSAQNHLLAYSSSIEDMKVFNIKPNKDKAMQLNGFYANRNSNLGDIVISSVDVDKSLLAQSLQSGIHSYD